MSNYRYQLERYRGRGSRYTCPQCHRKGVFTRYVDTHNNNIYISDNVGKCNRLDKCGYHYTPKQYFTDNPWKSDGWLVGRKHRETDQPTTPKPQPQWKSNGWSVGRKHRETDRPTTPKPRPHGITPLPRWFMEQTLGGDSTYRRSWMAAILAQI
jgi:hypothetical protein